jgi:hypothetical protein
MDAIQFTETLRQRRQRGEFVRNRQSSPAEKRDPKGGRKALTVWVQPSVVWMIKRIAAEQEKRQQELLAEFLNDGFAKYSKDQIA